MKILSNSIFCFIVFNLNILGQTVQFDFYKYGFWVHEDNSITIAGITHDEEVIIQHLSENFDLLKEQKSSFSVPAKHKKWDWCEVNVGPDITDDTNTYCLFSLYDSNPVALFNDMTAIRKSQLKNNPEDLVFHLALVFDEKMELIDTRKVYLKDYAFNGNDEESAKNILNTLSGGSYPFEKDKPRKDYSENKKVLFESFESAADEARQIELAEKGYSKKFIKQTQSADIIYYYTTNKHKYYLVNRLDKQMLYVVDHTFKLVKEIVLNDDVDQTVLINTIENNFSWTNFRQTKINGIPFEKDNKVYFVANADTKPNKNSILGNSSENSKDSFYGKVDDLVVIIFDEESLEVKQTNLPLSSFIKTEGKDYNSYEEALYIVVNDDNEIEIITATVEILGVIPSEVSSVHGVGYSDKKITLNKQSKAAYQLVTGPGETLTTTFNSNFGETKTTVRRDETYYKVPQFNYYLLNENLEVIKQEKVILPYAKKDADYIQMISAPFSVMGISRSEIHPPIYGIYPNAQLIYEVPEKLKNGAKFEDRNSKGNELSYYLINFKDEEVKPHKLASFNDVKLTPTRMHYNKYLTEANDIVMRKDGRIILIIQSEKNVTFTLKMF